MKTIRLFLLAALVAFAPLRAETTEMAASYERGQLAAILDLPRLTAADYTIWANTNEMHANLCRMFGLPAATIAYFEGRASVFRALAALYAGE